MSFPRIELNMKQDPTEANLVTFTNFSYGLETVIGWFMAFSINLACAFEINNYFLGCCPTLQYFTIYFFNFNKTKHRCRMQDTKKCLRKILSIRFTKAAMLLYFFLV